jgi:CRP-like cAMP-binding protein
VSDRILGDLRNLCERHQATLHTLITQAVSEGVRTQDIAEAMGISRATLWRRYAGDLQRDDAEVRPASR